MADIKGAVDPRYAGVREAFASCFADGLEHGGAVCAIVDGHVVADLWGGHADAAGTKPWQRDTLVNVWSATKGVVALAVAMLVERGKLDYAAPVASVWPEFAANGKAGITLDQVLSHQAGLNGVPVPMSPEQLAAWTPYVDALAAMAPLWEPGSRCVYHALSYGHLAGEPIRRVAGETVGSFIAREIAGPLGVSFYVGLPASEDHRAAEMIAGPNVNDWLDNLRAGQYPHAAMNPTPDPLRPNQRDWRAAEVPGGNGQADAVALATIYAAMAQGGTWQGTHLLSPEGVRAATALRFRGEDAGFQAPTAFGAGFRLEDPIFGQRAAPDSFGHSGWGGSIAFGDPAARLGFAYVTCRMQDWADGVDPRRQRLIEAVYAGLANA